VAQQGDIAVIQPTSAGNCAGHIEGYDGSAWISDFIQSGFWPGLPQGGAIVCHLPATDHALLFKRAAF